MIEVKTKDGTLTLKSEKYNECYHSSEGAFIETYYKHVKPAFDFVNFLGLKEVKILDICFGLGYNTFVSLLYRPKDVKLKIFSPELDLNLIKSLKNFNYPEEFQKIKHIINSLIDNLYYKDEFVEIEIAISDARDYIKKLKDINIVYQDAFSPKVNKELWTIEYFKDLKKVLNKNNIITTYSVATPVRCAFYKLGFNLYTHSSDKIRKGTIASTLELNIFNQVNFEEKLKRVECYTLND